VSSSFGQQISFWIIYVSYFKAALLSTLTVHNLGLLGRDRLHRRHHLGRIAERPRHSEMARSGSSATATVVSGCSSGCWMFVSLVACCLLLMPQLSSPAPTPQNQQGTVQQSIRAVRPHK